MLPPTLDGTAEEDAGMRGGAVAAKCGYNLLYAAAAADPAPLPPNKSKYELAADGGK